MKLRRAIKELPSLTREEIDNFLKESHLMRLAVIDSKGEPNVTPVWYLWKNNKFYITSQTNWKKYRDIKRKPRVGFSVDVYESEYLRTGGGTGVHGKGNAYFIEDQDEISRRDKQLILKYTGSLDNPVAKRLLAIPNACLIVVEPTELGTWYS